MKVKEQLNIKQIIKQESKEESKRQESSLSNADDVQP